MFSTSFAFHDVVFDKVVALCIKFWQQSTADLQQAVADCRDARAVFVNVPFTEQNAVFASDPWLWGVNADLSRQDEVIAARHLACNVTYPPLDPLDVLDREACYRASAGHPNITGAQQYADAIVAVL